MANKMNYLWILHLDKCNNIPLCFLSLINKHLNVSSHSMNYLRCWILRLMTTGPALMKLTTLETRYGDNTQACVMTCRLTIASPPTQYLGTRAALPPLCPTVCSVTCLITPFLVHWSCVCQPSQKPARWQALLTANHMPATISPFPSFQILQPHLSALLTNLDIYSSCCSSVTPHSPDVSALRFQLPKPRKWKEETNS